MAYQIRKKGSVQRSVRKIASEQIDKAIGEIIDVNLDRHEAVHQVRKRCKKLRGLIRLVRPDFGQYQRENEFFRDASRELSFVRDTQSMIDCYDALIEHYRGQSDLSPLAPIRDALTARRQRIAADLMGLEGKLDEFLASMREARQRVEGWKISDDGFSAIEGGLLITYDRGRKALKQAYKRPTLESFHEWRKRVKYHWYHLRLLQGAWPAMMKVQRQAASKLADLLGDDHDLAVLRMTLSDNASDLDNFIGREDLQVLMGIVDRRRAELQAEAKPIGLRLFAEQPKQFGVRLRSYWKTWKAPSASIAKLESCVLANS